MPKGPLAAALSACLLALSGCQQNAQTLRTPLAPPTFAGTPLTPLAKLSKDKNPRDFLLLVRLQLLAVQLPLGTVSDSEELWSYLNEEPAAARVDASLSRNGFRVGYGQAADWQAVERLLRRLTGKSFARATLMPPPDASLPWVLKEQQDLQTIFVSRPDRTLTGADYPPGENVLMLGANIDYDDLSAVTLMGSPVVRSSERQPRFSQQMGRYVLTAEQVHYALPDLAFQFKVPAGGFVVVGPGREARRPTSPGFHFLVTDRNGLKFETVLVIWPEVFAAPLTDVNF